MMLRSRARVGKVDSMAGGGGEGDRGHAHAVRDESAVVGGNRQIGRQGHESVFGHGDVLLWQRSEGRRKRAGCGRVMEQAHRNRT